jgi:hypothetical protein
MLCKSLGFVGRSCTIVLDGIRGTLDVKRSHSISSIRKTSWGRCIFPL